MVNLSYNFTNGRKPLLELSLAKGLNDQPFPVASAID